MFDRDSAGTITLAPLAHLALVFLFLPQTGLMAGGPWPISVQVEDVAAKRLEKIGEAAAPDATGAVREVSAASMEASLRTGAERGALRMTVVVEDLSGQDREVAVHFALPPDHGFKRALCPDGLRPRECDATWTAVYHGPLVLPLICLYTPEGSGLTLCADFDQMIPALSFRCAGGKGTEGIEAVFSHRRLPGKGSIVVTLYAIPHEGDWRPGVGWALARYPEYFRPQGRRVYEFEGGMIYDFVTPEERIARDKELDLQWQEVGWSWPHLGLYVPDTDTWRRQPRSDGGLGEGGAVTRQMIHDYLGLLRKHHVGSFMYFQSTESWREYAERNFPESMVRTPEGKPCPTWIKCVVMNPRPDGPFGRHILAQVDAMLRVFPEVDGLFWDQNCYGSDDFAQQDDLTMVNGRRCSNLEIAQRRMLSSAGPRLHAADKAIWSNGPCSIGVARHIDGAMSEGTAGARRMSWLCLAKPLIILSYDSHPLANEQKLMAALETGGQPAVTLGKKECRENEARYQDMLKLLLRREVVLTPYAYEPPEGFRGNVFRRPEGSLVVTLVREPSAAVPPMVEPAVRPPKDAHVQAVYEVSPEAKGLRQVGFTSEQGAVRWRVASPRNASMFLLAVSGRFLSTSQRVILPDSKTEARTRLENLCDEPWSTEVCVGEDRKTITVPAMSRLDVSFPVAAQAEGGAVRASLTGSSNRLIGPPVIEIPARPALDVWPVVADPQESANSTARVVFGVLNRTSEVLEPALEVQVEGGEATASPPRLDGGEAAEVVVTAGKLAPGAHRVSLQVSALGTESRAECIIRVTRTHFPNAEALRGARSLTVTMDLFNSLGNQYADKPVRVNGVEVGKLPVTGQTLQWHNDLSLTVKGPLLRQLVEKAIEADGASATFRVTVGNGVRNCFKVRRCRLSFGLADGTIVASAPDPFVRCSDMNWLYAEGKPVRMGEPVELGIFRCSIGSNRR